MDTEFIFTAFLWLTSIFIFCSANQCDHSQVNECYDPVLNATNKILQHDLTSSSGIRVEAIWEICRNYYTAEGCIKEIFKTCKRHGGLNEDKVKLYRNFVVKKGIVGLCDKPDIIHAYGVYGDCIYENWNEVDVCLENIAGPLNRALINHAETDASSQYCRIIQDVLRCAFTQMSSACNSRAGVVMKYLIRDYLPTKAVNHCIDDHLHMLEIEYRDATSGDETLLLGVMAMVVGCLMLFISMVMP